MAKTCYIYAPCCAYIPNTCTNTTVVSACTLKNKPTPDPHLSPHDKPVCALTQTPYKPTNPPPSAPRTQNLTHNVRTETPCQNCPLCLRVVHGQSPYRGSQILPLCLRRNGNGTRILPEHPKISAILSLSPATCPLPPVPMTTTATVNQTPQAPLHL